MSNNETISVGYGSESGVKNSRMGLYDGQKSLFTHRNPKTGEVFGEDLVPKNKRYKNPGMGMWVPYDKVEWL